MKAFLKRYHATIVGFFALTVPLFLIYVHGKPHEEQTFVENALMKVTAPAQFGMQGLLSAVSTVWKDYLALVEINRENQELRERLAALEGKALENRQLREENQRLAGLVELTRLRPELDTVAARVVGKDVSSYYRVIRVVIQAPSDVKLRKGMPVVTYRGVVGRVARVSGDYADVMLTVDARSRIDVTVVARGVTGTLAGRGDRDLYGARFSFLHRGESLKKGDVVVTSGHDRVFPPGLPVGYIAETDERQSGVYFEYDVLPTVNFATLEEVLVVLGERPVVPDFGRKR